MAGFLDKVTWAFNLENTPGGFPQPNATAPSYLRIPKNIILI